MNSCSTTKMASSLCLATNPSSLSMFMIAGLGLMLVATVGSFGSSYIFLTSTFLILSTLYLTLFLSQNPEQCIPNHDDDEEEEDVNKAIFKIHNNNLGTMSEYESIGDDGTPLFSEDNGSISDEDTLIELELPTGHYLSPKELEQHKLNLKQTSPDCYYSCSRKQQSWLELLSEANELLSEEDNFIEIDISIGSIMCPRFQIQA